MAETYGELLSELVDDMARYEGRSDIFRRNDISRNHFYNVTNRNRESSSGRPYPCHPEWGVQLTRDAQNFKWIKTVAKDCGGLFVSPDDIKELKETDPEKAISVLQKIVGIVK